MEVRVPSLVRVKPDALHKIGKYLRTEGFDEVALYYGEGMEKLFGEKVSISFASSEIKALTKKEIATHSIEDIFAESTKLKLKSRAIVAIGGGKVIDFCKYLGFINQLPVVSVPTSISNDGFCSPLSSLLVNKRRRTVKSLIPYGVIVDTRIVQNSPKRFIYSGMGDLFCKLTSIFDWKLAYNRKGIYVDDFAAVIAQNAVDAFIYYDNRNLEDLEYIRIIASSLMMSGMAMAIADSSRPSSGSEHLVSHAYDKVAEKPSLHGLQVGVASYAVSYIQEATHPMLKKVVQECGFLDFVSQNPLSRKDFIEAVKLAPGIKEDYYTVLSERGAIERLLEFIDKDEIINRMLA
jgi:glycerol-1-phosphate dehydrogenase [NAD(P)+]